MQRYSGGMKMPRYWMDVFTGTTTTASGRVNLTLTHTPKSIADLIIGYGKNPISRNRTIVANTLTGKVLEVLVEKNMYYRVDTPTATDVGSVGAPANHSHALTDTITDCQQGAVFMEAQPPITVLYPL